MNRLYISNSKYLFISIVFFVLCGLALIQMYYNFKNAPVDYGNSHYNRLKLPENTGKTIIYIGDSRSGTALVPEILRNKIQGFEPFNAGARGGNIFELLDYIKSFNSHFGLIIVCVSPASLFGSFVHDPVNRPTYIINLSTPSNGNFFEKLNNKLIDVYLVKFKFLYGFYELKNIILYNDISHYYTWDEWESTIYFGSSVRYARAYNYFAYKDHIFCNSSNPEILNTFKNKFSSYINDFSKNHKILLLRIPVASEMKNLEDSQFPWFDDFLSEVASANKIKYMYNFGNIYTSDDNNDWSHLSKYQAIRFSESLSDSLNLYISR